MFFFRCNISVDIVYTEHDARHRRKSQIECKQTLSLAVVHDASFAGQPGYCSHAGYVILVCDIALYDEPATTHLLELHNGKIHRKVASTLAAEGNAASQAYDRAMWARAICYEI